MMIVIIGGGIIGHMIAHHLAEAGHHDLTIVERDRCGLGASARSAGLHFPLGASLQVRDMTAYSQLYYQKLAAAAPQIFMRPVGMRVHLPRIGTQHWLAQFIPESKLRPAPDHGPVVTAPARHGAWRADGAQHADVGALIGALSALNPAPVTRLEGLRATALCDDGESVDVTLSDASRLRASAVILAPGPWALAPAFFTYTQPLGIRIKRIVAFHIGVAPHETDDAELFMQEDAFLLPNIWERRWLFSYTCQEWDVDAEAGAGLAPRHIEQARAVLETYAPAFAARLQGGRMFCDAYSPSRIPIVEPVSASGRIIFAGAANGAGYRLAPAIAAQAVSLIKTVATQEYAI